MDLSQCTSAPEASSQRQYTPTGLLLVNLQEGTLEHLLSLHV